MSRLIKNGVFIVLLLLISAGVYVTTYNLGVFGELPQAGTIEGRKIPASMITGRLEQQEKAAIALGIQLENNRQILFGDLHVHSSYSADSLLWSLPMNGGEGPHPVADACDFARYCSALDFWSITDHAESLTPKRWQDTKESMRSCQAVSGDGETPDLVSFTGFEWSQEGDTADQHFGHRNVIFKHLDEKAIAARPIAAAGKAIVEARGKQVTFPPQIALTAGTDIRRYTDFNASVEEVANVPICDASLPSWQLPKECTEIAATPADLIQKLEEQKLNPLIIPLGTTRGTHTPPGARWQAALKKNMRPERTNLVEIYSGHGNAEEYRNVTRDNSLGNQATGEGEICATPSDIFVPGCWQAGEIIRQRCVREGLDAAACDARAVEARENYRRLGNAGELAVPDGTAREWLNAGQCSDCFEPALNMRFATSVQAGLASQGFEEGAKKPTRFVWGFIGSSDNHRARPGTGYKEYQRRLNTDANGPASVDWKNWLGGGDQDVGAEKVTLSIEELLQKSGIPLLEMERNGSFFYTGGLAAVHSQGRSREEIWNALQRRETFATSGPRILLWFHLLNGGTDGQKKAAMGAEVKQDRTPQFSVSAIGAFKQAPGIPQEIADGISKERLEKICGGEAYNPTSERHKIVRIEIVRIRPQTTANQDIADRIDDPFVVKQCEGDVAGCRLEFSDPDYMDHENDAIYYARGIQEATPTINGDNLRCTYDDDGRCVAVNPCFGDYQGDAADNCLAPQEHRAWSSPIFLRRSGG